MRTTSDTNGGGIAKGAKRALAAFALSLAFVAPVHAGPAAGTVIPNQATGSAQVGPSVYNASSNTVTLTVSGGGTGTYAATLETSRVMASVTPGTTVYARHVLTNTGTAADTYALALADGGGDFSLAGSALYLDANDDGLPDSATPIAAAVALAPGQALRFVAAYATPATITARATGRARISASSVNHASIAPNTDEVASDSLVLDCASVSKFMTRNEGPSPAGPITVSIAYTPCDKPRARVVLTDTLPAGMHYVAGSAHWSGAPGVALTDGVVADDLQGTGRTRIAYDWNVATANTVTATVSQVAAGGGGSLSFDVEIDANLAVGTVLTNRAQGVFYDASDRYGPQMTSAPVTYTVTGRVDLELVGQRLPTAVPGATLLFTNVLTNKGTATETFDITLGGSTFPAGTTFALFKADGTTPLADTDGNGTADTGPVAAGASYTIILRARTPQTAPPAAYKVTKTARAASAPMRSATADDSVDTLSLKCALVLEPDNQATIGLGQHVTYTHYLTNTGNCVETVTAGAGYLTDSQGTWKSAPYVDTPTAGNGSIPGALDATDVPIGRGSVLTLQPGASQRLLMDVSSPSVLAAKAAKAAKAAAGAKALVDSDVTTLVLTGSGSGNVTVRDTTTVDDKDEPAQPSNVIRNFTDSSYQVPTLWGVIGSNLWLRADASSCNAVPDVAESRTVVITGPNGEREEVTATETGPNTGIFAIDVLPIRVPPVTAGNHAIEGRANDVLEVQMLGCGQRIETVVTLMQPTSVVFDSRTNEPVAGATVALVGANGTQCSTTPVDLGATGNPVVTGSDGGFAFPALPAGRYCLAVKAPNGYRAPSLVPWTQLPATRNLNVTGSTSGGSYGGAFAVGTGGLVVIDVPVDAIAQDGLFVQKEASRQAVELGEFVDYSVHVRNSTGNKLDHASVIVVDDLPSGFAFIPGTARRDGQPIPDPAGGIGPHLILALGTLERDAEATVQYRVRVGAGAMRGDGVNRVQASYTANGTTTVSNIASAKVQVSGGVFTDQGFILGKVFLDCNANGEQDRGEPGVPGVRLVLEDGTYIVTDGAGRFSFYGIENRTHVLKADRTTLPAGAHALAISARNLGDGGSRIVDLKSGQMARADFALGGCSDAVVAQVKARIAAAAARDEISAMAGTQLATQPLVTSDVKAMPASGVVAAPVSQGMPGAPALPGTTPGGAPFDTVAPSVTAERPSAAPRVALAQPPATPAALPLEEVVAGLADNNLAFIGLKDGDTVAYAQATVRVKGAAGSTFRLTVNGADVGEKRVGKRSVLADKQLQAWEYIGVELKPGRNTLAAAQVDQFGNARGTVSIEVVAPDKLGRIAIDVPAAGAVADGKTAAHIVVRLTDANGVPVTVRTPVTLEASNGKWQIDDLDPAEPGVQQFVENGRGEFLLMPPIEPGNTRIVVTSGPYKAEQRLDWLPELRNLIANGVIEGIVNVRHLSRQAFAPTSTADAFEQEIRHVSRDWNGSQAGARAAFYLKGKIKGEYLLTAAYDSDKDTQERLFRDIQPDEFYPIYGDSAVRGFDAQSTSKLYVRVDNKRSYLLWGDFTTAATDDVRKLANYSRSLTGVKEHYENGRVSVTAFASHDTSRQVIEELRANGTSGPFQLGTQGAIVNSEKVEIITRDRNQPALILQSVAQARFADYEIEVLTGRILFKAPISSVDQNLNPVFIRVTYEVDQGGEQFWVVGVDGQVKVTDRVQIGGVYVKDKNPLLPFTLGGANLAVKIGDSTFVIAEAAQTEAGLDDHKGNAGRIEVKHESANLKANVYYARTDRGFDNPGSYLSQGRGESGGKLDYKLTERATIKAEALRTEDVLNNAVQDGASLALHYQIAKRLSLEIGVRHAAQKTGSVSAVPPVAGEPAPEPLPDQVTTVRARVNGQVPGFDNASIYGEAEVDVHDADKKVVALGGEYTLPNKGRVYARHEFISSINGPYGLNANERQNTTAVGVDTEYMKDGRVFSEYRIRDAMDGGDTEAALGLKNLWTLSPGLRLGTTFERVQAIAGTGQNDNTALTFALEYTGSEKWKGSTRVELRKASTQESLLWTVGLAARVSQDWTALARNAYSLTRTDGAGDHVIERLQAGMAWRDTETNRWNMLARIEDKQERDQSAPGLDLKTSTQILSVHADWQPRRPFLVSARYAAKWTEDNSSGLSTRYRAQVVGARATWEFASRWDIGVVTSVLFGEGTRSKQYGVGFEAGYLLAQNLWVSAGYNVFGYKDADMAGADYTARGPYVRLRYKFDETTLDGLKKKKADGEAAK